MRFFSKIFGKLAAKAKLLDIAETRLPSPEPSPREFELVYEDGIVGLRHIESGQIQWVPWGHFQYVHVVMLEPFQQGQYRYDITAEFDSMEIEWEINGFEGFLEAMRVNLDDFDIEPAAVAINQLGRERRTATIYASTYYA
jgi:hypothetical protein